MFLQLAENGNEAVKIINEIEFDVIISDIKMPQMDGFELCRWVMENKPGHMERFVLATGIIGSEVDEFCSKYNVKYINKPFDKIELLEIISKITVQKG